jgi:hypothetical protein
MLIGGKSTRRMKKECGNNADGAGAKPLLADWSI